LRSIRGAVAVLLAPPRGLEPQPLEVEAPRSVLERWHVKRGEPRFDLFPVSSE